MIWIAAMFSTIKSLNDQTIEIDVTVDCHLNPKLFNRPRHICIRGQRTGPQLRDVLLVSGPNKCGKGAVVVDEREPTTSGSIHSTAALLCRTNSLSHRRV